MERFYIVTNKAKDRNHLESDRIKNYLEAQGKFCILEEGHSVSKKYRYTDATQIPKDIECILVIGGDGTLIQAARDLAELEIPLIGVNLGTLGYLTEVERENLYPSLDKLIRDECQIEERMMLEGTVIREGKEVSTMVALNDVVFSRSGALRVIDFKIYLNGKFLNFYSADGIIIATPTGSTGYNLSAGGPVLVPHLKATIVTPICPHSLNKRSLIVDASDRITLEVGQTKDTGEDLAVVAADGRNVGELSTGDRLVIEVPHAVTQIIKLSGIGFYERMREKLNQA